MSDSAPAGAGPATWMSRGTACRHADPELFFPTATAAGQAQEAKAVCARCPVRTACLAYALATRQPYGVWGGATEKERRAMNRSPHRAAQAPAARDTTTATATAPGGAWRLRHLAPRKPSE
jgi:WhiB family transcriptional regulator, redox-sensing transcriptional regulator